MRTGPANNAGAPKGNCQNVKKGRSLRERALRSTYSEGWAMRCALEEASGNVSAAARGLGMGGGRPRLGGAERYNIDFGERN